MNFDLSPEQELLKNRIAAFCENECAAELEIMSGNGNVFPSALYKKIADNGFFGIPFPAGYGGGDGNMVDVMAVTEQMSFYSHDMALIYMVPVIFAGMFLLANGTEEQKESYLPRIVAGELKYAFAMTEPEAGSDPRGMKTYAAKSGGNYTINGTKYWTTGASVADYIITVTLTSQGNDQARGMTVFVVPSSSEHLAITPIPKLAGNTYPSCQVVLDGVVVPAENIVGGAGAVNTGLSQLRKTADIERLCIAACCIGTASAILKECVGFAKTRIQSGQPIIQFQAISHDLADMAANIEAMRWMTYHAAWLRSEKRECLKEISMAKLFCSEILNTIVKKGMQIFGGRGYSMEYRMQRYLRESFLYFYAGGTSEIQKNLITRYL
jgi:alkylation response protein AidB-like acyl-CoA dehydrogenase